MQERKLKFETLQLHVGQESPDPKNRRKSSSNISNNFICI